MEKLKMQTADMAERNIDMLGQMFPNCLTETINADGKLVRAIDFDKLRQELACEVVEGAEERYQFTWPDKRAAIRLANAPTNKTLRPCREESVDFDNTENLYIEGDNLEVLKLLRENYLGKVKMIYIDPPYNTGNDFVYNDDFAQSQAEFAGQSGLFDEEGHRMADPMVQNTESNGRFHTDWLNMIYPRLKVAKDLLTDDGVIFISIDDNEVENLKQVCNEVFGKHNYLNTFAWVVNLTGRQIAGAGAAKTWETILVYSKNASLTQSFDIDVSYAKKVMPDAYKGLNRDIRTDERGQFSIGDTLYNHNRKFNEETRPNLVYSIFYNPETQEIKSGDINAKIEGFIEILPHANGDGVHKYHAWRWSRSKVDNEAYDLIVLPTSRGGYEVYTRIRTFNQTTLKDIITNISNGDAEVQALFDNKKYFDYPKSVNLLKCLLGVASKDSIFIDFFSGSATTAHAVMQLNAEDGGNRKFIMVQLPEKTDEKSEAYKAGYKNICEIGKERIRRAGKKIKEENATKEGIERLDTGFRVLKLDESNMADVYYTPADTPIQATLAFDALVDNIREGRTAEDLLFQVLPECNLPLSSKIETREIHGKKVFVVEDGYLMACFDNDINDAVITAIAKEKPYYFVMCDRSIASDSVADNFDQIFNAYSKETVRRIL